MQPKLVNVAPKDPSTVKDATGKLFVVENTQLAKTQKAAAV